MYYLYKNQAKEKEEPKGSNFLSSCTLEVFEPNIFKPKAKGEKVDFKTLLVRLSFLLTTKGKVRIYLLRKNEEVIHASYVIPKCSKFPFMSELDLEIGPCNTIKSYRRKGCYLHVLQNIVKKELAEQEGTFYMLVNEENIASMRGIEKAGFKRVGKVKKEKRRYQFKEVL